MVTIVIGQATSAPVSPAPTRLCLPIGGTPTSTAASASTCTTRACATAASPAPARSSRSTDIGITTGGIITLLDPNNPEFLVKILNACATSFQSWWVFYSATTDLGFTLTVIDRKTGDVKTYTNEDLHAATPVQDTKAFLTCAAN